MDKKAKIKLELVDVFGLPINDKANVVLTCLDLTDKQRVEADASSPLVIPNLIGPPNNRYRLDIEIPGYRAVTFIKSAQEVKNPESQVVFFAVDPSRVSASAIPRFRKVAGRRTHSAGTERQRVEPGGKARQSALRRLR